jgi:hypothetical protein
LVKFLNSNPPFKFKVLIKPLEEDFTPETERSNLFGSHWSNQWLTQNRVIFCVRGVISPLLANVYLHYALDQWVEAWRRKWREGT